MAWIESHQSLKDHRKTIRLSKILKVSKAQAIGHLHCLWWWCLDNASDGNLTDIWPEELAEGALWSKDVNDFLNALIESRFIDREENKLFLHDWHEYAGKLVDKRIANKDRMRQVRSDKSKLKIDDCATHVQCTCGERATHVDGTCNACAGATVHYTTQHNSTQHNTTVQDTPLTPPGDGVVDGVPKRSSKQFKPPSLVEVKEYFDNYENGVPRVNEAEEFWNYWESVGWRMKSGLMKDWKAAARNNRLDRSPGGRFYRPIGSLSQTNSKGDLLTKAQEIQAQLDSYQGGFS